MNADKYIKTLAEYGPAACLYVVAAKHLVDYLNGKGEVKTVILFATIGTAALLGFRFIRIVIETVEDKLKEPISEWIFRALGKGSMNLFDRFQAEYYKNIIYEYRGYRTQGLKTKGPFTFDLSKIFVPLRIAPESFDSVSAALIQEQNEGKHQEWDIWNLLRKPKKPQRFFRKPKLAIIGPPGSGKSTLLEHLALTYAEQKQKQRNPSALELIPILFRLKDIQHEICVDEPPFLETLFQQQAKEQRLQPPETWIRKNLKEGRCLVMLDGLDEVANDRQRKKVTEWVDKQIEIYGGNAFLLTSRPFGYRSAPVRGVVTLEVKLFSLPQMQTFIQNWYLQTEISRQLDRKDDEGIRRQAKQQADDLIDRIKNNPPIAAMALNPLLLTMITTVHINRNALPGSRVELYREICDVLLGRRQQAKGIDIFLIPEQKQAVLQVLALTLMERETREFDLDKGAQIIRQKLNAIAGQMIKPENFLQEIIELCGLLVEQEKGRYEFAHKSFQEYLAAVEIKATQRIDLLVDNISHPWWGETIRLYAAQSDATALIQAALDNPNVIALQLAYDCMEDGLSVDPHIKVQLEEKLILGLESNNHVISTLAAEVKLVRRLNNLLRIDNTRSIDNDLICCAEYQLFIDEMQRKGKSFQPDHWPTNRFQNGHSSQPVTGIGVSDAVAFCSWLSEKYPDSSSLYRIPNNDDLISSFPINTKFGFWCIDKSRYILKGYKITTEHQKLISMILYRDFINIINRAFLRAHYFNDLSIQRQSYFYEIAQILNLNIENNYDLSNILEYKSSSLKALDNSIGFNFAYTLILKHNVLLDITRYFDIPNTFLGSESKENFFYSSIKSNFNLSEFLSLKFNYKQINNANHDYHPLDCTIFDALNNSIIYDNIRLNNHAFCLNINQRIRYNLLVGSIICSLIVENYTKFSILDKLPWPRKKLLFSISEYSQKRDILFNCYILYSLMNKRQSREIPAWESLIIIKEQRNEYA